MDSGLPDRDVVLLGAGHTNAHVLRMWRMAPIPGVRLTCVSNFSVATYSGMLPGTLAGLYPPDRMQIDLVRRSAAVGARFIRATATGLDVGRRELVFRDRPPLPFDVLSIGIGSVPRSDGVEFSGDSVLPVKPMQLFLQRLEARVDELRPQLDGRPLSVAIVGAGVAGIEISFCLPPRLERMLPGVSLDLMLIDADEGIGTGLAESTLKVIRRELDARGVRVVLGQTVRRVSDTHVELADGKRLPADLVLWMTSAAPPDLLAEMNLPTDEHGFLLTRPTLQSVSGAPIFAVGDSGTIEGTPVPRAGVYAVRQGPVLWENIGRTLRSEPLVEYKPQSGFMKLLATGDGRAILSYKGFTFHGRWCWKLKDSIDSRFMDKHQDYTPMPMTDSQPASAATAMRCAGCGGKVGGMVLSSVLGRLEIPPGKNVLVGLESPDDAAVVLPTDGRPLMVTTDFFTAPLDDPYLVGRIAALNAASDVYALGGSPLWAVALAAVPVGNSRQQEQMLFELLSGGLEEFRKAGATLVGGHTIEAAQVMIGFTLMGDSPDPPRTKSGLRVGDRLILTKPLGTGVLLAAAMQAQCRAEWMESLLTSMLQTNATAAALIEEFDVAGVTDVTGFGLAGHLLEMLNASNTAAELELASVPLLPGAGQLLTGGVESTLAPANRAAEADIECTGEQRRTPEYAAMFDPQTSGGLLLGVPGAHVEKLLARLGEQSELTAALVGRVVEHHAAQSRIRLR